MESDSRTSLQGGVSGVGKDESPRSTVSWEPTVGVHREVVRLVGPPPTGLSWGRTPKHDVDSLIGETFRNNFLTSQFSNTHEKTKEQLVFGTQTSR